MGGVSFNTLAEADKVSTMISDRRLYLNADKSQVVEHGDQDAAFLFVGEGCELPLSAAEDYGVSLVDGVVMVGDTPPPVVKAVVEEAKDEPKGDEGKDETIEVVHALPEDIPGHTWLEHAGLKTLDDVRKIKDLVELEGIGKATAAKILKYLDA